MPWQAKVAQPKPEGRAGELKSIQFGFVRRSPLSCAAVAAQQASPCLLYLIIPPVARGWQQRWQFDISGD